MPIAPAGEIFISSVDEASRPPVPILLVDRDSWRRNEDLDGDACLAEDEAHRRRARRWAEVSGFSGAPGETLHVPDADGGLAAVCAAVDPARLGEPWTWGAIAERLPAGDYRLATKIPQVATDDPPETVVALGFALARYRFDLAGMREKEEASSQDGSDGPRPVRLLCAEPAARRAMRLARAVAEVRDLVNAPADRMGPQALAEHARRLAEEHGAEYRQIVGERLLEAGYPAIHAVGRAGGEEPRLVEIVHGRPDAPKLVLVGKGVCFDTGGLDLKTAAGMRRMKKDMGGAAHALALARLVMEADLDVRLRVLVPAVYNAVGPTAYRPGDVVGTRAGLTVEIGNTDAEGRLVLADALAAGAEDRPELMIDFATLTGAARVALGPDLPALFSRDDRLADELLAAGRRCGDPLWRMPLHDGYATDLKSEIADLNNIAPHAFAGAIIAALFLDRFAKGAAAHAHLDIYAWNEKTRPARPAGGEAMGLRAVFALLERRFARV